MSSIVSSIIILVSILILFLLVFALQHLLDEINSLRKQVWRMEDELNIIRSFLKIPPPGPRPDDLRVISDFLKEWVNGKEKIC